MKPILLALTMAWALTCVAVTKEPAKNLSANKAEEEIKPILSSAGAKRIQENVKTLDLNIRDAQANMVTCEKNLKVLQSEVDELLGLEKEHVDLKAKLNQYLDVAKTQAQKNKTETAKLTKAFKDVEATPKTMGDSAKREKLLDKLHNDEAELTRWKTDAEAKVKRANEMLKELGTSLTELTSRKNALRSDLETWTRRRSEYDKLLVHYRQKKVETEQLIKSSKQP